MKITKTIKAEIEISNTSLEIIGMSSSFFVGSTDITQPNFNPYYYLLAHKSNAKYVNFVNKNIST
jgi:hypothetical protein